MNKKVYIKNGTVYDVDSNREYSYEIIQHAYRHNAALENSIDKNMGCYLNPCKPDVFKKTYELEEE